MAAAAAPPTGVLEAQQITMIRLQAAPTTDSTRPRNPPSHQRAAISGTWANTDSVIFTINGKNVTSTLTTEGNTRSSILNTFAADLNAATILEFAEMTWANYANTHIQGTGDTAGVPFTITDAVTTAGDGDLGAWSATTPAAGPYCANTADNWSTDATPTNSDDVVFENLDVSCKYQLDALSGVSPNSITIRQSFTGDIGLPRKNTDAGTADTEQYNEYRQRYLQFVGSSGTVKIGEGDGSGSGRVMLDFGSSEADIEIYGKGTRVETGIPCVLLKGGNAASSLVVVKGDIGVAFDEGSTADLTAGLSVSFVDSKQTDSEVVCGSGTTLAVLNQQGGTVQIESNCATITQYGGDLYVTGTATSTTLTVAGRVFDASTGTKTNLHVTDGGQYDRSRTHSAVTATNVTVHAGAQYLDPNGTITETNGIDLYRCNLAQVTVEKPKHKTITYSAI